MVRQVIGSNFKYKKLFWNAKEITEVDQQICKKMLNTIISKKSENAQSYFEATTICIFSLFIFNLHEKL